MLLLQSPVEEAQLGWCWDLQRREREVKELCSQVANFALKKC